ncbi:alpha/beta hydrolase [Croceicoccus gelatinilyticus]|uniref:alpha/beta hydrolase n=1 Tax=Croceicoccus gelatinilyticus TaxID=2835536 RepID=UPI001BCFEA61|nr:alpha/beta hydrolase [Croceicoccus gelatinilyticus]MBS7669048.1 alpha/beta hydrolase [Croceicoccus gelatinilyticus]
MTVRRRFHDLADRQIHYRESGKAGDTPTLFMLHLLPGSSLQLVPLMEALGDRHLVAPDLSGLGDSEAEPEPLTIAAMASDVLALIEAHGDRPVDLYGTHTGACVAIEIAARHPGRVRRLIIDGVPIFDTATAEEFAARYAPVIEPDHDGTHLLRAHNFCRDQFLFYPWYDHSAKAARGGGLPPADVLFTFVKEVLKASAVLPAAYRAAFTYPTEAMLAQVPHRTLCLVPQSDTLAAATRKALDCLSNGQLAEVPGDESNRSASAACITEFLSSEVS